MNDTPGWASPGSAPSDGHEPAASRPAEPEQPADQPVQDPQSPGAKWSTVQPPAGQWSAPTGQQSPGQAPPPPPPGPGWGTPPPAGPGGPAGGYGTPGGYGAPGGYGYGAPGHGAWGGGWGGPPPAAKPGVIPLRPLGVGEILDGAVSTMRTYWRTVLGITLSVAVVTEVLAVLLQGLVLDTTGSDTLDDPSATLSEVTRALGDTMLNSTVIFLISMIGTVTATALLTTVTSRAVLGRPVTFAEAWRDARTQLARLFGLIGLLILIGAVIFGVGITPGILVALGGNADAGAGLASLGGLAAFVVVLWLMVRFSLASPALMLEKQGIRKSMGRSAKLVRGSWWRVFGIQLLAAIIANIVAALIVLPFTFIAAAANGGGVSGLMEGERGWTFLIISGIGSVIGSMITFPISAGVTVLLYIDQRIRREALDLELARAAGLQDHSTGPAGSTPRS
ncbi:glycerophosphoryl diester phosphodiesterase membrane domain-containing protein [Streptomyces sp. NPDC014006]|uniref:glycerophosphoryl diester phosphodiesterase membrane domain-containing protein n=1 Tax=Streptomyces sp. NPDC014006 TaxID=3364870 RepID=UPI0036FEB49A